MVYGAYCKAGQLQSCSSRRAGGPTAVAIDSSEAYAEAFASCSSIMCEDVLRMVEIARREGRRPKRRDEKSTNTQSPSSWVGCLSPDSMCEGADCSEYDCTGTLPDEDSGVKWGEIFGVSED